jgi:ribosomal protein L37AE/L43A
MASKNISVREWKCESCGATSRANAAAQDLPPGWTVETTTINIPPGGPHTKGLDLCPECTKNTEAAVRRYRASLGQ